MREKAGYSMNNEKNACGCSVGVGRVLEDIVEGAFRGFH